MTSGAHYKRPESVLVVIYTRPGDILLLQRCLPPDFWQSVTGSLKEHELPADAARREVLEETGLSANRLVDHQYTNRFPIHPAWRTRYAPDVKENREHVFSLCVDEQAQVMINPREHQSFQWLPFDSAAEKATSYTNRDAILILADEKGWTK